MRSSLMGVACTAFLVLVLAPAAREATRGGVIVFSGVRVLRAPGLVTYDADGTHAQRLVTGSVSPPVVAVDGGLAYGRVNSNGVGIRAVLSDGRGNRVLGPGRPTAFSPDGSLLLVAGQDGDLQLYDRLAARVLLTLPQGDSFMGWAGDGILYDKPLGDRTELHLIDVGGDRVLAPAVNSLGDAAASSSGWIAYETGQDLRVVRPDGSDDHALAPACAGHFAWSPDGSRIACSTNGGISFVGLDGAARMIATAVDDGFSGSWSPDGARFAFGTGNGIEIADPRTGSIRQLAAGGRVPQWSPDGRWLSVIVGEGASTAVVPAAGGVLRLVARDGVPAWLPDGRLLVRVERRTQEQIATILPSGRALRFIPGTAGGTAPSLSPDRSKLVFLRVSDEGPSSILECDADGTHRHVLARTGTAFAHPVWSPDGRLIAYPGERGIELVAASGRKRRVAHTDGAWSVSWSPDGKRLAFAASDPSHDSIDFVDLAGRHRQELVGRRTLWGASDIAWSPDGKQIAFALQEPLGNGEDVASLALVNVRTRGIDDLGNELQNPAWSPDGSRIAADSYGETIDLIDVAEPANEHPLVPGSDPSWSD